MGNDMSIIVFGASGAGSTTLGKEVAKQLDFHFFDIDDYLWNWDTKIPFTVTRPPEQRTQLLLNDIKRHPSFVISGTIFSNSTLFEPFINLAVFISTPAEVCAERVRTREHARWGKRVLPGGDMYRTTRFHGDANDYISNAQIYETAEVSRFGRKLHEKWITEMTCPVMRADGTKSINENTSRVIERYFEISCE